MTPIQLSNGGVALVDDSSVPRLSGRVWRANHRYVAGKRAEVSAVVSGSSKNGTFVQLHRFLTQCPVGLSVDHVDGNPLNNCLSNLRICSASENMRNRKISRSNKCGFKGVYKDGKTPRYRAEIKANGKRYRLGSFQTAGQAHAAYLAAAQRLHGLFARAR